LIFWGRKGDSPRFSLGKKSLCVGLSQEVWQSEIIKETNIEDILSEEEFIPKNNCRTFLNGTTRVFC
jgi:hypothetical protein